MQLPTLRRPIAASALAGILGAGIVDAVLSAGGGAAGQVFLLALGLYGAFALLAAFGGAVLAAALDGARPPGWGKLRDEPSRDRAVAAAILACLVGALVVAVVAAAGQRLFVGKMQSQKLATIAAGGLVAIGALPGALVAIAALPLLRRIAQALPRPRALGATGVLLITIGGGRGARVRRGAVARRLAGARPRPALCAGGRRRARRRARSVLVRVGDRPRVARALSGAARVGAVVRDRDRRVRLPDDRRAPARGLARLRRRRRRLVGHALSARRRPSRDRSAMATGSPRASAAATATTRAATSTRAREDVPGNGVDENCEGGDAKASGGRAPPPTAPPSADAIAPIAPRADGFKGNLLIVTIDALRGDRLGVAGYGRPAGKSLTPTLDALARKGAYFRRAWSQAPNTPRSFPVILTGRYPSDIAWDKPGVNYPNLLPTNHTFFETLAAAGWKPIGIFSHFYFTPDRGISRGFAEWSNDGAGTIAESNKDIASPRIVPRVIARLRQAAARKEHFALWTHLFEPHSSYMTHKEFPTSLSGRAGADGEVRLRDRVLRHVGQEAASTRSRSSAWPTDTAIVVMADHGEAWGEHKVYFHGQDLFDEQLRVPLIIVVPGQKPQVIDDPVALVDVAPTLLDLVGAPIPANMRGRSLLPRIAGGKGRRRHRARSSRSCCPRPPGRTTRR